MGEKEEGQAITLLTRTTLLFWTRRELPSIKTDDTKNYRFFPPFPVSRTFSVCCLEYLPLKILLKCVCAVKKAN